MEHDVYGQISVELMIQSMDDARRFIAKLENGTSKSLNNLTAGFHYHTIEAANNRILDAVERALDEAGYLVKIR